MKLVSKIELYKVDNGYVLKGFNNEENENGEYTLVAAEDDNLEDKWPESVQSFLYSILKRIGPSGSRYSAKRVFVQVVPGENTDGLSTDEEYLLENFLIKKDKETHAAYGKRIYAEMEEMLMNSKKFRKENGYSKW